MRDMAAETGPHESYRDCFDTMATTVKLVTITQGWRKQQLGAKEDRFEVTKLWQRP